MFNRRNPRSFRLTCECLEERLTPANNPALVPPVLNSFPGAAASLYLDFNGHTDPLVIDNTGTPHVNVDTPPFDTDGNINSFSPAEMQQMYEIWQYVAEDFLPFNLNVTTVQPPSFAPLVAERIAIGGSGAWLGAPGTPGIYIPNGFSTLPGPTATSFLFSNVFTTTKSIGDGASFLAGRSFGLDAQSEWAGAILVNLYYPGLPDGTAPLVGDASFSPNNRSLWWYGTSLSATTFQDDMSVIASALNGFGYRADDYGNTTVTAFQTGNANNQSYNFAVTGQINTPTDPDVFRFSARLGIINISVTVPVPYNNLDVKATLLDVNGNVLVVSNPTNSFDATITYSPTYIGDYFLVVESSGPSANATATNVGANVGSYSVSTNIVNLQVFAPIRWIYDPRTTYYYGYATILPSADLVGPYSLTFNLPAGVSIVTPVPTVQTATTARLTFNSSLKANTPSQFLIQVKNPLNSNLGTYYNSFLTNFTVS